MAGVLAQGATFSFGTHLTSLIVTGISVETPQAEVVNMTGGTHAVGQIVMVPTGDLSSGTVSVDYIHSGSLNPVASVAKSAALTFSSAGYSVTRTAILLSATTEARMGDIVRGNLKFQVTDYSGS